MRRPPLPRAFVLRSVVLGGVLAAVPMLAIAAGSAGSASDAAHARIVNAAMRLWIHGIDDEIAAREVGAEGVPILVELLRDPSFPRRDNVVAFLTHLHGPGVTDALVSLLARPPADPGIPEEDRALLLAPGALGAAAARGDADALRVLRAMASEREEGNPLAIAVRDGAYGTALRRDLTQEAERALRSVERAASEPVAASPLPANVLDSKTPVDPEGPAPLAVDTAPVIHDAAITFANHVDLATAMSDDRLDRCLTAARRVAGHVDFTDDLACCLTLTRSGTARSFGSPGDGLDRVDDSNEANQVLANGTARVKVVRTISWCGGAGTNIAGCAYRPGGSMMVVRITVNETAEGVLWLHEYGHNVGLQHNPDSRYIMYASLNLTDPNDGLTAAECGKYHSPDAPSSNPVTDAGECHDRDADDWVSSADNCPDIYNPGQIDSDRDGIGDSCEGSVPDRDGDGIPDSVDNCPDLHNSNQSDRDADGVGDVCDPCTDADGDGFDEVWKPGCPGSGNDCDDTSATIYPLAPELCDGLDNDCDGFPDERLCEELDVNGDLRVDGHELAWIGRAFGSSSPTPGAEWWYPVDYDRDGDVDGDDLAILAAGWVCSAGTPICP